MSNYPDPNAVQLQWDCREHQYKLLFITSITCCYYYYYYDDDDDYYYYYYCY